MNEKIVQQKEELPQQQEQKKDVEVEPVSRIDDFLGYCWEGLRRADSIYEILVLSNGQWSILSSRKLTVDDYDRIPESDLSLDDSHVLVPKKTKGEKPDSSYFG